MKKFLSVFLACILVLGLSLTAVSAEDVTTIKLWHRWSGDVESKLTTIISQFEAENPGIKVEVTAQAGEYFALLQKMIADLAAGIAPPDLFLGGYNLFNYIYHELDPNELKDLAPNEEAWQALVDRYEPNLFDLGKAEGVQISAPFALSNIVMYYNKDIFTQAGLSDADIPKTWDDLVKVSEVIKEKTGKYAFGMQKVDSWPDLALIYSNGGTMLSEDGKKVAFNNEQAVEAISLWQSLHQSGYAAVNTDGELMADFIAGNVAMYISSVMKLNAIRTSSNFELGVAEYPSFGDKPRKLPAGGAAFISFTDLNDAAKKDAVWKFIEYATNDESMKIFTQTGYVCVTKAEVAVAEGQQPAYNQLAYAVPWTNWPGGSAGLEIDQIYINKRTDIIHGDLDPAATLDALVEQCNALLD